MPKNCVPFAKQEGQPLLLCVTREYKDSVFFFFFLPPPEPPIFQLFPLKPLMSLSSTPLLWFISFLLLNRAIMYIVECTDFNAVSRVLVNVYMQVTPLEKIHHISITSKVPPAHL